IGAGLEIVDDEVRAVVPRPRLGTRALDREERRPFRELETCDAIPTHSYAGRKVQQLGARRRRGGSGVRPASRCGLCGRGWRSATTTSSASTAACTAAARRLGCHRVRDPAAIVGKDRPRAALDHGFTVGVDVFDVELVVTAKLRVYPCDPLSVCRDDRGLYRT